VHRVQQGGVRWGWQRGGRCRDLAAGEPPGSNVDGVQLHPPGEGAAGLGTWCLGSDLQIGCTGALINC
jgi:hypothetical protein